MAALVVALLSVPMAAFAWIEFQVGFKGGDIGWGCVQHTQSFNHEFSDSADVTASVRIENLGISDQQPFPQTQCASSFPYRTRQVSGKINFALIKRVGDTPPGGVDNFEVCRLSEWGDFLPARSKTYTTNWFNPPCGPGYYAMITCLGEVRTATDFGWGLFTDTVADPWSSCIKTPMWHPIFSNPPMPDPPVNLGF